ncbi:MAG TPA: hypothetical protein VFH61_13840 [Thermoleophilia bacterium]|nr:hypothetical protein [Thermoleophilia bacterium]
MTSTQRQLAASDMSDILRELNDEDYDLFGGARIEICDDINEQREAGDHRAYAHVHHDDDASADNVICVAMAFFDLPYANRMGLLWHEVGHWLDDEHGAYALPGLHAEATEIYDDPDEALDQAAANSIVYVRYGRRIDYDEKGVQRLRP